MSITVSIINILFIFFFLCLALDELITSLLPLPVKSSFSLTLLVSVFFAYTGLKSYARALLLALRVIGSNGLFILNPFKVVVCNTISETKEFILVVCTLIRTWLLRALIRIQILIAHSTRNKIERIILNVDKLEESCEVV